MAFCLGGISIYELAARPWDEVMGWFDYFSKRPYQWREDDRTYKILQTQGADKRPEAYFASLRPIFNPTPETVDGLVNTKSLKNSVIFQKILAAKGGDKLEVLRGN